MNVILVSRKQERAESKKNEGNAFYKNKQYKEALQLYSCAIGENNEMCFCMHSDKNQFLLIFSNSVSCVIWLNILALCL